MPIALRPARSGDFEFCARLYFSGMEETIQRLKLDMGVQNRNLRERWSVDEVQIITMDGTDIGWMQSSIQDGGRYLEQIFIDAPFQGRGAGSEIINGLIGEAKLNRHPVTLGVVKTNPALRLYERLGFQITHEDDRKFYMRCEP